MSKSPWGGERKKPARTMKQLLEHVNCNPETDCVAVLKPGNGCAFHIPQMFEDNIKANEPMPHYVSVLLLISYIFTHADDPKVRDFVNYIYDRNIAELSDVASDDIGDNPNEDES